VDPHIKWAHADLGTVLSDPLIMQVSPAFRFFLSEVKIFPSTPCLQTPSAFILLRIKPKWHPHKTMPLMFMSRLQDLSLFPVFKLTTFRTLVLRLSSDDKNLNINLKSVVHILTPAPSYPALLQNPPGAEADSVAVLQIPTTIFSQ
jgi:hypothetical protein